MLFKINLKKDANFYLAEAPDFDILTQGKNKSDALEMLKSSVEILVSSKDFNAIIKENSQKYYLSANNYNVLIALLLKRQRQKHGITLKEIAHRLGSNSANAFARYEQGKAKPSIQKLNQLISAINPKLEPVLQLMK